MMNMLFFFFFNDTATTEIYTLSLHDALPTSATRQSNHLSGPDPSLMRSDSKTLGSGLPTAAASSRAISMTLAASPARIGRITGRSSCVMIVALRIELGRGSFSAACVDEHVQVGKFAVRAFIGRRDDALDHQGFACDLMEFRQRRRIDIACASSNRG